MQLSTTESEPTPLARDPTIQQLTILATVTSYVPFAPSPERNRSHSEESTSKAEKIAQNALQTQFS
ncbi:Uncharacterised protein [Salmonella enterica]|uniref:Uncharacterized protein n=1 Tax=Salmonella sp. NCTC 3046 TaxID=2583580 RepID=A0A509D3R0_9ENTR|nr:Uncharacterised protein [Salmonella enterica]